MSNKDNPTDETMGKIYINAKKVLEIIKKNNEKKTDEDKGEER